jgi:hypothetical protein
MALTARHAIAGADVRVGRGDVGREDALTLGQAIQIVVLEALHARATVVVGVRERDVVLQAKDVADLVVAVREILEERVALGARGEGGKAPVLRVVRVGRLDAIALLDEGALLELVVVEVLQVPVAVVLAVRGARL